MAAFQTAQRRENAQVEREPRVAQRTRFIGGRGGLLLMPAAVNRTGIVGGPIR